MGALLAGVAAIVVGILVEIAPTLGVPLAGLILTILLYQAVSAEQSRGSNP